MPTLTSGDHDRWKGRADNAGIDRSSRRGMSALISPSIAKWASRRWRGYPRNLLGDQLLGRLRIRNTQNYAPDMLVLQGLVLALPWLALDAVGDQCDYGCIAEPSLSLGLQWPQQ